MLSLALKTAVITPVLICAMFLFADEVVVSALILAPGALTVLLLALGPFRRDSVLMRGQGGR